MKLILRILAYIVLAFALLVGAFIAWSWAPDIPVEQLKARWAPPPSQFIDVDSLQVHVRDEGPRADPLPIVLVHGTSASLHTWEGWASELKKTRRVIRFDLPGFGLTGPNANNDYTRDVYVRFVGALMDKLGVQRFVIGGNSLGGDVAWTVAHAHPQRVDRLILVDSAGYPIASRSVPLGFRIAGTPALRSIMANILPPGLMAHSIRNVYGDPSRVQPELVALYTDMARRTGNRQALGAALQQRLAQMDSGRERDIKTLKLPTLILWGGQDRLIPPAYAQRFAADIAGAKLVMFEQLGHVPQEEDPAATLVPVRTFLQEAAAGGKP
ncbi:alpha/beta fold hydrolase [Curvibacter sp. PAE-UM]|uniref:alpha/beta fold hydrolase n=1 Tax=Curvibacter sp. PAE-UM TaxID=1714344 RepID=UPI00070E6FAC|nr:alpha/beta hydrolase [Curvibacter sp. PAE-UM]KRH99650.1 alpha/beta hydrolase [Curvibacter sp. PAE-UM]